MSQYYETLFPESIYIADMGMPQESELLQDEIDFESMTKQERLVFIEMLIRENPDGFTLEEIGEIFGWTKEYVRQIRDKALKKMAKRSPILKIFIGEFRNDQQLCFGMHQQEIELE